MNEAIFTQLQKEMEGYYSPKYEMERHQQESTGPPQKGFQLKHAVKRIP